MNKLERIAFLKANKDLQKDEVITKMLATVNGETNVAEGDTIAFAESYKPGDNIAIQEANGNNYLSIAVTIGDTYDDDNAVFISSGSLARRFAFVDKNTKERKTHTIDGKPFKGSNEVLLQQFAGKKLKWDSTEKVETTYGETTVRNWVSVE
jgi:hypothetical protein